MRTCSDRNIMLILKNLTAGQVSWFLTTQVHRSIIHFLKNIKPEIVFLFTLFCSGSIVILCARHICKFLYAKPGSSWLVLVNSLLTLKACVHYSHIFFLHLTGVLCLRLHASCFCNSDHCYCLCNHCGNIFHVECWELSLAMDFVLLSCIYCFICVFVFRLLLLCKDQDVRLLPNKLLFWIHSDVQSWSRNALRYVSFLCFFFSFWHRCFSFLVT